MKRLRTILAYISLVILGVVTFYATFAENVTPARKILSLGLVILCLLYFATSLFGNVSTLPGDLSAPQGQGRGRKEALLDSCRLLVGSVAILLVAHLAPTSIPNLGRVFLYCVSGLGMAVSLVFLISIWARRS